LTVAVRFCVETDIIMVSTLLFVVIFTQYY